MKKIIALILCLSLLVFIPESVFASRFKLADVNGDNSVNTKDILAARKYIAGYGNSIIESAADINADGSIDMKDVLLLRRHIAGIITIDQIPLSEAYIAETYISGVSIKNYSIVIPEGADAFTLYAAELLQDYIDDKMNTEIPIVDDSAAETEYEFLIGETNREESVNAASGIELGSDEYLLKQDGTKIVMLGDSYMIGGGVGKFTYDYMTYAPDNYSQICRIDNLPTENLPLAYEARQAKNVIFMIGDGMGSLHPELTLFINGRRHFEEDYTEFYADRLPALGYQTTYSLTTLESGGTTPTDSAASGTALACGYKSRNSYLGLDGNKTSVQNIRELASSLGKKNAIITTDRIEGATPAAFTVHYLSRQEYNIIALQQGLMKDCDYLKGGIRDELLDEVKYTLDLISTNNEAGFFTMIEEAYIDKSCHSNSVKDLVHAMQRFNVSVGYAMVFAAAHPDTLLLITADHETGGLTTGCRFTTSSHTTADVKIYSIGSGSEKYTGTINNTDIPKVIAAEWGVTDFGDQTLN